MTKSVPFDLFKMMVEAMRPPVAGRDGRDASEFTKGSEGAYGMAKDIQYLKEGQARIEAKVDKITETHVTVSDFNDHCKSNDKVIDGQDVRIRSLEISVTRIMTVGSIILVVLTIIQILLRFYGH